MTAARLLLCDPANVRGKRAGYTLLEIMVVMALMVVLAAITIPSINSLMADARVDAAGDMIRGRMADARSMAMEEGKPYRFGFVPGTGKFQIAADDSDEWHTVQDSAAIDGRDHVRGSLPEDVVFGTDPGTLSESGTGSWHVGGVFLPTGEARGEINPDGTNQDDVTFYFGRPGTPPRGVRMHGLTGTVRVFDPSKDDEEKQP
jgi:prepilin-type N-terminal cleavage/methylation domain-containing protein